MTTNHNRGILWAVASAFCIAAFVVPWKIASQHGESSVNTLLLLSFAATFTSVLTAYQQRSIPVFHTFDLKVAAALAVCTLLGNLASAHAIAVISPALLTLIQRSEVIIVALLAWPIIGERIDRRFWLGAALAAAGLLWIQDPVTTADPRSIGVGWGVVSALCFGSMSVITRKFIHRFDTVSVNALRLWLAVGLWFCLNGVPPGLSEISAAQAGYTALAALFGPFVGRLCLMTSAKYIEARMSTLATLAAPPLTLALAFIVLSDWPSPREIQGGMVMLIGISIPILGWAQRAKVSAQRGERDMRRRSD